MYTTLSNENGTISFLDFSLAWLIPTRPQIPSDVPVKESKFIPLERWNIKKKKYIYIYIEKNYFNIFYEGFDFGWKKATNW